MMPGAPVLPQAPLWYILLKMGKVLSKSREKTTEKLKEPQEYRVVFLNDNYTTMEFVVGILMGIFHKNPKDAEQIMLEIHLNGKGTAGIYPWDIAVTKANEVHALARENDYPLKCVLEPV